MMNKKKNITFSSKATERVFLNASYKFIKKRKIFYVISALVILGGIGSLATRGLDIGVEFTGGRKYHIKIENSVEQSKLKDALTVAFDGMPPLVKSHGSDFQYEVTTKYMYTDPGQEGTAVVDAALDKAMEGLGKYQIIEQRQVDKTMTETLMMSSLIAVILS
jgi:SecD/SecF fusion protein